MTRYWKTCPACGDQKPRDEFYRNASNRDGLQGQCKMCSKYANRVSYIAHIAARRKHDIERYRNDPKRHAAVNRIARELRRKYPDRVRARRAINNAVASGRVVRMPCDICGTPNSEGHHDDYTKPLEVRWLCRKHHNQLHHGEPL